MSVQAYINLLCLEGYYRKVMAAASTFSSREDPAKLNSVYSEFSTAVAITVVCVAALTIVVIVAVVIWHVRCRKSEARQQSQYFLNLCSVTYSQVDISQGGTIQLPTARVIEHAEIISRIRYIIANVEEIIPQILCRYSREFAGEGASNESGVVENGDFRSIRSLSSEHFTYMGILLGDRSTRKHAKGC